jgi:hypothetical protein
MPKMELILVLSSLLMSGAENASDLCYYCAGGIAGPVYQQKEDIALSKLTEIP